jgi:phosphatidylglycerophosphatase A
VRGVLTGLVFVVILGILAASRMEELTASKDPGKVVIDEIAGYLLTMLGSPPDVLPVVAGFLLFRLFDILKPPPIKYLERALFSGLGIMADDLMAGVYAWCGLRLLERFLF